MSFISFDYLKASEVDSLTKQAIISLDQNYFPIPWTSESWNTTFSSSDYSLGLLKRSDQLVGVILFIHNQFDLVVHIVKIIVDQKYRRQGLGRELWQAFVMRLGELYKTSIYLEVETTNQAAISFYNHLGGQRVSRVDNYYGPQRHCYKYLFSL